MMKENPFAASQVNSRPIPLVEGPTNKLATRIVLGLAPCMWLPLLGFLWINGAPRLPYVGPEAGLLLWTAFFLWLSVMGPLCALDKTRIYEHGIESKIFFTRRVLFEEIAFVEQVTSSPPTIWIKKRNGKEVVIMGCSNALLQAFLDLQLRFPPPGSTRSPA
jgi:hypothetical protein